MHADHADLDDPYAPIDPEELVAKAREAIGSTQSSPPSQEGDDGDEVWAERRRVIRKANVARARSGRRHDEHCTCNNCTESRELVAQFQYEDAPKPPNYIVPLDGYTIAPKGILDELRGYGELVADWKFPHNGKGAPDCGTAYGERVAVVNHQSEHQNVEWWRRAKKCGLRNCPECGPEKDDRGRVTKPGSWEVRTARRAADHAIGHLKDIQQQWKLHQAPLCAHVAISPPRDAWEDLPATEKSLERLQRLRRTGIRLLKQAGVLAGYLVGHSHRIPGRYNNRKEPEAGLHWHAVCLTRSWWIPKLNGDVVKDIHRRTGWVIKNIIKMDDGEEVAPPGRDPFATLVYLLSHATWPSTVKLVEASTTNLSYPAWLQTSTQRKALIPFGKWSKSPRIEHLTPLEEDKSPVSGVGFAPDDVFAAKFDRPPPRGVEYGSVPRGYYTVDTSERVIEIRWWAYHRDQQAGVVKDRYDPPRRQHKPKGLWMEGVLFVPSQACRACERTPLQLEPEWRRVGDQLVEEDGVFHRGRLQLTGTGALQCAVCGEDHDYRVDDIEVVQ